MANVLFRRASQILTIANGAAHVRERMRATWRYPHSCSGGFNGAAHVRERMPVTWGRIVSTLLVLQWGRSRS